MVRKVMSLIMVLVIVLSTAGCAAKPAATATPQPVKKWSIVQIQPQPKGTPFPELVYSGLVRLQKEFGADKVEIKIIETLDKGEYAEQVRAAAEMGYNPIVTLYDDLAKVVLEIAPSFPNTQFVAVDTLVTSSVPNVVTVVIDPHESSFLAGIVAAKSTKTKKVGFVGSTENPVIWRFCAGFSAGVKYANVPGVEQITVWSGTSTDPVKGLEVATSVFKQGADIIMHACNKCGLGVIQAAQQEGKQAIGVDMWQGDVAPGHVMWSALKDAGTACYEAAKKGMELPFETGLYYYDRAAGATLYDKRDYDAIPADLQKLVQETEDKIVKKTIMVPTTKEELEVFKDHL